MRLPYVKQPCKDCPFRKDSKKGWLGEDRMTEIIKAESFVCHKNNELQCAGHMILNQDTNMFVGLASRLGLALELGEKDLVFDSKQDCINHHKE